VEVEDRFVTNSPAEIFGYHIGNITTEAKESRRKHWCPFVESVCDRISRSITYPLGVCTISQDSTIYAVCPHRFAGKGSFDGVPLVLETIALHYFGGQADLVTFSDVKLPNYGTIDFVLAKHKPCIAEIDDFVPVELRAFSPVSIAQLVRGINDFMAGVDISNQTYYNGINIERTIRMFLAQVFNKGIVYETWSVKSYWVIQEYIYANLVKRYGLKREGYSAEHASRFALQEYSSEGNKITLHATRFVSVSVDEMYQAMRNNPGLPSRGQFVATLNDKLKARLSLKFE